MTMYAIAAEAVIVLALLWALLEGQPAGQRANLEQISSQATQMVSLQATNYAVIYAKPTPTPACYVGTQRQAC